MWAFVRMVPSWAWVALGLLAAGWWYGHARYQAGDRAARAEWAESVERGKREVERLKEEAGKVTTKIEYRTVEKVRTIHEKGDTIIKYRDRFVPTDSGYLSGGFRMFYDAAITNTVPEAAAIPDAAPVAIADVADTHAYNAKLCNIAYSTVEGWQAWAREQEAVNPMDAKP